jgi:hypothetical protein
MLVAENRTELAVNNALADYLASGGVIIGGGGVGGNYFSYFAYAYGVTANFFNDGTLVRTPSCF